MGRSFATIQTALVSLSPEFVAAIRQLAPQKRRARLRWVVAAAVVLLAVTFGRDRATRELVAEKAGALRGAWGPESAVTSAPLADAERLDDAAPARLSAVIVTALAAGAEEATPAPKAGRTHTPKKRRHAKRSARATSAGGL